MRLFKNLIEPKDLPERTRWSAVIDGKNISVMATDIEEAAFLIQQITGKEPREIFKLV